MHENVGRKRHLWASLFVNMTLVGHPVGLSCVSCMQGRYDMILYGWQDVQIQ